MSFKVYRQDHFGDTPKLLHTISKAGDVYNAAELAIKQLNAEDPAKRSEADEWAANYKKSIDPGVLVFVEEVA